MVGGLDGARGVVIEHVAGHVFDIDEDEADSLLDGWRVYGIVKSQSLGEYLDEVAASQQA